MFSSIAPWVSRFLSIWSKSEIPVAPWNPLIILPLLVIAWNKPSVPWALIDPAAALTPLNPGTLACWAAKPPAALANSPSTIAISK